MTISNPDNVVSYLGNGATTVFPYTFIIPGTSSVRIYLLTVATNVLTLLSPSDYTITNLGVPGGGNVTYPLGINPPITSDYRLVIQREVAYEQSLDLTNQSQYFPVDMENQLDKIVMMIQQLAEESSRTIKTVLGSTVSPDDLVAQLLNTADAAAISANAAAASASTASTEADNAEASAIAAAASAAAAAATVGPAIHAAPSKTVPVGADEIGLWDSGTSALAKLTWANLIAAVAPEKFPTLSNTVGNTATHIDFTAASVWDNGLTTRATIAALTKRLDANWAVGTGNGMRYSGAGIANGWYYIYAVWKIQGANADYYADPSASEATALGHLQAETGGASYAYIQRVAAINRAGGSIRQFHQYDDRFMWDTPVPDVSAVSIGLSASNHAVTIPPIPVRLIANTRVAYTGGFSTAYVSSPDQVDVAASSTDAYTAGTDNIASGSNAYTPIEIDTSNGQIRARATIASTSFYVNTRGYVDRRGR